jgi:hypothetical protein
MTIPTGYSLVSFTFTCAGTARNVMNTWGVSNGAQTTAAAVNAVVRTQMVTTAGRGYSASFLCSPYTLVSQKILSNFGGVLYSDEDVTNVSGTGSALPPPVNTAMLVTKQTGIAGRKYRGRVFAPWGLAESVVDAAGIIAAGSVTTQQTGWNSTIIGLTTAGCPAVLLHGDGSTPTALIGAKVEARCGTIGRRIRG